MTKFNLCLAFMTALVVGLNFVPSLVYAQADQEAAQPGERPQSDNAAQPDQAATPDQSATKDEQGDATDEPENQADDQSAQKQE